MWHNNFQFKTRFIGNIFIIFFALFVYVCFTGCTNTETSYTHSTTVDKTSSKYRDVVIIAALNTLYWYEMDKLYTKNELDNFGKHKNIVEKVEAQIGFALDEASIKEIEEERKAAKYDE